MVSLRFCPPESWAPFPPTLVSKPLLNIVSNVHEPKAIDILRQSLDEVQNVRIPAGVLDVRLCHFFDRLCGSKEDVELYATRVQGLTN